MAVKRARHGAQDKPELRDTNYYLALMEKTIRKLSYRHSVFRIFQDFVEMAALSMSNAVDLFHRKKREERYLQIVKGYTPEELAAFPKLCALLALALEQSLSDVLGVLYHRLEIHNEQAGQFFTPDVVCYAMAQMLVHDAKHLVEEKGFIRVQEPCVGSGAMIIALAQACKDGGLHYQQAIHVTAIDINVTAVHMAYVQLFLLHIPAVVLHGDTLRGAIYEAWSTAAHVLDLWEWKLRRAEREAKALAPEPDAAVKVEQALEPVPAVEAFEPEPRLGPAVAPAPVPVGGQLTLF
jgi:hypothetical protein